METRTSRKTWAAPYVLAALVMGMLALSVVLLSGGGKEAPTGAFGMSRGTVLATQGAELSGRLLLPAGVDAGDVRWSVRGEDGEVASGSGRTWRATAGDSGTMTLDARVPGTKLHDATRIRVVDGDAVLGSDVHIEHRVLVDGGVPVQGEALAQGAKVDATGGAITFTAHARLDTGLSGDVRLEGTELTLRSEATGKGRVRNVVELERTKDDESQLLVADVEHLDGTRYVEVRTPDAVAMVKGTRFYVRLDADGTDVAVDHGWVVVASRAEVDVAPVDVRDRHSTNVPRTEDLEAAASKGEKPKLEVRAEGADEFDDVVDTHRRDVREQLEARGTETELAPTPAGDGGGGNPPGRDPRGDGPGVGPGEPVRPGNPNPNGSGNPASGTPNPNGSGTNPNPNPTCGPPRCPNNTGEGGTPGTPTGSGPGTGTTPNPGVPGGGETPVTTGPTDGTKPPVDGGTTIPPSGTGSGGTGGTTNPNPNCPTTGCDASGTKPPSTSNPNPNPPTTVNPNPPTGCPSAGCGGSGANAGTTVPNPNPNCPTTGCTANAGGATGTAGSGSTGSQPSVSPKPDPGARPAV